MSSNLGRAALFRDGLAMFASMRTGREVTVRIPITRKLSEAFSAPETPVETRGDLLGLPGAVFVARCEREMRVGPTLDEAVDLAAGTGRVGVAILWRRGRTAGDQVAVLRYGDLVDLLERAAS